MESKVFNELVQGGKWCFYLWNQFMILVHSNLQKSPPKLGKSQNPPLDA